MNRPTPERLEEIRAMHSDGVYSTDFNERAVKAGSLEADPPEFEIEELVDIVNDLLAESDAQRELLRHLLLSHRPCGAGCDWSERVDAERIRLRAGDGVVG